MFTKNKGILTKIPFVSSEYFNKPVMTEVITRIVLSAYLPAFFHLSFTVQLC